MSGQREAPDAHSLAVENAAAGLADAVCILRDERDAARARAEKAEAERRAVLLRSADAINDQGRELARLRDGIQALADEWGPTTHHTWMVLGDTAAFRLRALLNPTPEGNKP